MTQLITLAKIDEITNLIRNKINIQPKIGIIKIVSDFKERSVFAEVLISNLNNPEIWNLYGTIISSTNRKTENPDKREYLKASSFYQYAIFFSKENIYPDQKYAFNFINAKSTYLLMDNQTIDQGFIFEAINYLGSDKVINFVYKDERTDCFFNFLANSWKKFRPEEKQLLLLFIDRSKNYWIKEKTKILEFG
ncbi:MAG: hypothetical protein WCL00_10440 [Bacteroidota bacterium]